MEDDTDTRRPGEQASVVGMANRSIAPIYAVPGRKLAAVEHPMIIKDLDKAIKTFGRGTSLLRPMVESINPQSSLPLWLRHDNPTVRPLISHNASSHNVLLKVTVPKRTGLKRKRGSDEPFQGDAVQSVGAHEGGQIDIASVAQRDDPLVLRRKLQDNIGRYQVQAVGVINHTHRYRGLADFQYSMARSNFMTRLVDDVLPGDLSKLRNFAFDPGLSAATQGDVMPPPFMTPSGLPFPYNYSATNFTGKGNGRVNRDAADAAMAGDDFDRVQHTASTKPSVGFFISHDAYPVPTAPKKPPNLSTRRVAATIAALNAAMEERPVWTRRSITNHVLALLEGSGNDAHIRSLTKYVGYQFKGGPWRDALVKYGVDPRSDPKYRIYQTLSFKLEQKGAWSSDEFWYRKEGDDADRDGQSHVFDGKAYSTDGRLWQICDITDPLLASFLDKARVRPQCDVEVSGWYHRAPWMVAKGIMKVKILAIRFGKNIHDAQFRDALRVIDGTPPPGDKSLHISLPVLQLNAEERNQIFGERPVKSGARPSNRSEQLQGVFRVTVQTGPAAKAGTSRGVAASADTLATPEDANDDAESPSGQIQGELEIRPGDSLESDQNALLTALEDLGEGDEGDDDDNEGESESDSAEGGSMEGSDGEEDGSDEDLDGSEGDEDENENEDYGEDEDQGMEELDEQDEEEEEEGEGW